MSRGSRVQVWLMAALVAVGLVGCAAATLEERPASKPTEAESVELSFLAGPPAPNLVPTAVRPETALFVGATVFTAAGPRIEGGSVLIADGKIVEVSSGPIEAPEGAVVVDARGKFITPGLIDTHSHLGVYPTPHIIAHSDGNEATSPATADVRAEHSVWPQDPGFQRALEGGVTTLQVLPGSANLIGGRGVTVKLHPAVSSRAMRFPEAPWGLKMACGENPKRVYGDRRTKPSTRMGSMAVFRATFQAAAEYRDGLEKHERELAKWEARARPDPLDRPSPPRRDLGMETLVAAMEGDILVHVHCYRADEMIQLLELADEFGFEIRSFHHAVEAYKIRDVLARWEVAVSTWADWWGFKIEAHDAIVENAALLHTAGARAIIHSDSSVGIQRLNQEAAKALFRARDAGLDVSEEDAMRWITANAAWALGVESRTGTLEAGKMADLVVWSGHPFSVYSRPLMVYVDGVREFDVTRADAPWSDFEVHQLPSGPDLGGHAAPRSTTEGGKR